jgi:pyruvate dehydrogenase E1 component alpha subunit
MTMTVKEVRSIIGPDGVAEAIPEELTPARLVELHGLMVTLRAFDARCLNLNRQGRIHFFAPSTGQEASMVGSAFALDREDWIFPTYREQGALMARGVSLRTLFDQIFGTAVDLAKGRQMPNHWASREHHVVSISSPIATQIPQSTGFAYAQKLKKERGVTLCYMGEGNTSEGDFHAGLNFAGVWKAPVVFFCQNNQWAITVPFEKQTASGSIAVKAQAYGFEGVRVDGNDVLAVFRTVRQAVEKARAGGGPTLVEALTYRMGPHSTSDDPRRYRPEDAVEPWRQKDPIARFERFLRLLGHLDDAKVKATVEGASEAVRAAAEAAEKVGPPKPGTIFDDVFSQPTQNLIQQRAELDDLIARGIVTPPAHHLEHGKH